MSNSLVGFEKDDFQENSISSFLEEDHNIVLSIPLETNHVNRKRQLVIVSAPISRSRHVTRNGEIDLDGYNNRGQESNNLAYCILGIDTVLHQDEQKSVSLGFVLKILWGMETILDGDGGFGIHSLGKHFKFKPLSLQFLWTGIQTLHSITASLIPGQRHSICVLNSDFVKEYENKINSPQSCINEWNEMSDILSKRPASPDEFKVLSSEETDSETLKTIIKSKLREIMKTVDLDDITGKYIRLRLETEMGQNLSEYKGLIDEEVLLIFGQMDPASKIFDFLYLGSEWNASNLEELKSNGVTHILNVTREIDNFFPAVFKYLNIREYDVEETDLLQYWDITFRFIRDCIQVGGKCLVHCKMGISRSASTVMSFAMKYFSWNLEKAMTHTKERRSIVNPNPAFRQQLVTYEGILNASNQRKSFSKKRQTPRVVKKNVKNHKDDKILRSPSEPSLTILDQRATNYKQKSNKTSRPLSWSPHSKFLIEPTDGSDPDARPNNGNSVQYHCYSQLTQYIHDPHTLPYPAPISSTKPTIQASPSPRRFYSLPGQQKETGENNSGLDIPAEDEDKETQDCCPAKSHLSQCTCDLELELSVSEIPVNLFEETPETENIMKNLGSLPIHIRHAQQQRLHLVTKSETKQEPVILSSQTSQNKNTSQVETSVNETDFSDDNFTVISHDDQTDLHLDTAGFSEELSVKTLANMFDFRLSDPSMTKNLHKLIKESKIDAKCCTPQPLPTIDVDTCSEC